MAVVLFVVFVGLLLLDVPVVFCMLASSLAALLYAGVDPVLIGLEMSRGMASFLPFLAVPFFILAGDLMNQGGLSGKITDFASALVGHRRGGLAMVTTLSAQMFGAVSGASSATCTAIGRVMIPAMERQGYPRPFSAALAACSGTTGALIPPSIVLLIYGVIANVSVEKLFLAGVVPGILIGLGLMATSWQFARGAKLQLSPKVGLRGVLGSAVASFYALALVLIIFGGILGGVFTATEAAAVAVVYALLVSLLVYRRIGLRDLPRIFIGSARTAATLSFLISAAGLYSWVLAYGFVPQTVSTALISGCDAALLALAGDLDPATLAVLRRVVVLLVVNAALLVVGMFLDAGPALLIVVPVLQPVGDQIGMDPVHFGAIVVSNLVIGLVTPPIGTTLFVASGVGEVKISQMIPYVLRFLRVMLLVQLLITFVPWLTTWPNYLLE
jgi:tripartite ATP-independent transporter DctM subunit